MKTIEERAKEYVPNVIDPNYVELPARGGGFFLRALRDAYIAGAKEQKAIDDAEYINQVLMGKVSTINYDAENHYKQGYHDAVEKAYNIFCYTGCPHKTDSYNCFNNKCETWEIFKRMMEE